MDFDLRPVYELQKALLLRSGRICGLIQFFVQYGLNFIYEYFVHVR